MQLNIKKKNKTKQNQITQSKNGGEDLTRHFSKEHTEGQQTYEKMLNITNYQRNANQNYNEGSPHTGQKDHQQKIYKQ